MVESKASATGPQASKKRRLMPADIANRFSSKADFLKYFRESRKSKLHSHSLIIVQLYVPPELMVNKDFLRQVLSEEKLLFLLKDVKFVNVPAYDELSVKNIWPHCQTIPDIMKYFPDSLPAGRNPDREFFFNVLNTLNQQYVSELIAHANAARHSASEFKTEEETINVSENMIGLLNQAPFHSRKILTSITFW